MSYIVQKKLENIRCSCKVAAPEQKIYGPFDKGMWQTRNAGYWESHILWTSLHPAGHVSVCMATKLDVKNNHRIDVEAFSEAVRAIIYNQPALRCNINMNFTTEQGTWFPATDFSDVFFYRTCPDSNSLEDISDVIQDAVNERWEIGSGKPLFRTRLLELASGYALILVFSHTISDGHTGKVVLNEILRNYTQIMQGNRVKLWSVKPMGCMEGVSEGAVKEDVESKVKKMKDDKYVRKEKGVAVIPFDWAEVGPEVHPTQPSNPKPVNLNYFRKGTEESFLRLKRRCKEEGITIGSFMFAAAYFTECIVTSRATGSFEGVKDNYIDILVNLRTRLPHLNMDNMCGFYSTVIDIVNDVSLGTPLWDLAKKVHKQVREKLEFGEHFLFPRVKRELETGADKDKFLVPDLSKNGFVDLLVSNIMSYDFPTSFPWGDITSTYFSGSYWCPMATNYGLIFNTVNNRIHYTLVHNASKKTKVIAKDLLDTFVDIAEKGGELDGATVLKDLMA